MSSGLWRRDPTGLEPARTTCQRIAQGQRAWIVPDLDNFIQRGIIQKGDKKTVDGKRCREWKIADLSGPGPLLRHQASSHVTLCLDLDRHLPLEMDVAETQTHVSYAFDSPIHIDRPEAINPEPSAMHINLLQTLA